MISFEVTNCRSNLDEVGTWQNRMQQLVHRSLVSISEHRPFESS
jgi:hypothetical protein